MLIILLSAIENEEDRIYFTNIYYEYKQIIFKTAYEYLDDKSLIEDCVQNTFLNLIKYFDTFKKVSLDKRASYISSCCKYAAQKMNMKNHYEVPYDDHLEEYTLPDKSNSYDELDKISLIDAIDNLDEKYREPFIMKYVKGFSLEEISDMLGIAVNLVKQRLFRAKKILYESLMED